MSLLVALERLLWMASVNMLCFPLETLLQMVFGGLLCAVSEILTCMLHESQLLVVLQCFALSVAG